MLTITIRTDKSEAEIGLFENGQELKYETWQAHRELAETIHTKINELLRSQHKSLKDIQGVVVYKGPGSFTGLRIGITVANALAYSVHIPIVSDTGAEWIQTGLKRLQNGDNETIVLPEYGREPNITKQKK